jgi:hypothetical protein
MIMSGNGTAYRCSAEALARQKAKAAGIARQAEELERRASEPVVCEAGADCELKWSRAEPELGGGRPLFSAIRNQLIMQLLATAHRKGCDSLAVIII